MSFLLIRARSLLLVVAFLITGMLAVTAVQTSPAGAAATVSKSSQAKKRAAKQRAVAKRRAVRKRRVVKRRRAIRKRRVARKRAAIRRTRRIAGLRFYRPPARIPARHGKLIWQRKVGGLVPLKDAAGTRLVLYSSKTVTGKRVAVSGSVSIPRGKAPRSGWPLITYGHGTTGIADKCAPSRNAVGGPAVDYINYTDDEQNSWLRAGYAVARTDYEGLGTPGIHPFLVGASAGRGVLDIVRAAREIGPKISRDFLIAGHSQGGQAALFAAGLAADWVPDLNLEGTVAYAPASNFRIQATFLKTFTEPSGLSALATMLIRGVGSVYDQVDPPELLGDAALDFWPRTLTDCMGRLSEPDMLGGIAPSDLLRHGDDYSGPESVALLNVLDQQNPALPTKAPILLTQGLDDATTLPVLSAKLDSDLREVDNTVDYRTYAGADHGEVIEDAHDDVMSFFAARLPAGR